MFGWFKRDKKPRPPAQKPWLKIEAVDDDLEESLPGMYTPSANYKAAAGLRAWLDHLWSDETAQLLAREIDKQLETHEALPTRCGTGSPSRPSKNMEEQSGATT